MSIIIIVIIIIGIIANSPRRGPGVHTVGAHFIVCSSPSPCHMLRQVIMGGGHDEGDGPAEDSPPRCASGITEIRRSHVEARDDQLQQCLWFRMVGVVQFRISANSFVE